MIRAEVEQSLAMDRAAVACREARARLAAMTPEERYQAQRRACRHLGMRWIAEMERRWRPQRG